MNDSALRVRVAIVNDYPVVVQGVRTMLGGDDRVDVIELDSLADPVQHIDVALFDTFASQGSAQRDVSRLLRDARIERVAIYTWNVEADLVDEAVRAGVSGFLSKSLGASDLSDALVRIAGGDVVVLPLPVPEEIDLADWPGRAHGLSAREAEVIGLITQGVTNADIARRCFLSENSVKSYIRTAYRKIGVQRRSQAVRWGMENGMMPRASITILDPAG